MRTLLLLAAAALLQGAPVRAAFGQTGSDVEREYGKPVLVYTVSEHIWMTPEFNDDGQMCRARLYGRRVSADTNYLGSGLPPRELRDVLNRLAPPRVRGEKTKMSGLSLITGSIAETTFGFETVAFTFLTPFNYKPPAEGVEAPLPETRADAAPKSEDIFDNPLVRDAQIVVVTWKDRKCAKE